MIFVIGNRYFLRFHLSTGVGDGDTRRGSFEIYEYACHNGACYFLVLLHEAGRHDEKKQRQSLLLQGAMKNI